MRSREAARPGAVAAVAGGILLALAFPRADLGPLGLVALVPFLLSIQDVAPPTALARGYLFGAVFFGALLYWIPQVMERYGGLPALLAWPILALLVLYLATWIALFAAFLAASRRRLGPLALAFAPFAWVAIEIGRSRLLTGFPWGLLGYTQYRNLPLLQAASWGGVYAVSFLAMAANAGAALLLVRPAAPRARAAGLVLLGLVGLAWAAGLPALRAVDREGTGAALEVAAVQGNVAQDRKWSPGAAAEILADLGRLTREAATAGARLIVWPESSSPFSFRRPARSAQGGWVLEADETYASFVTGLARSLGASLIVGSVDYGADGGLRAYNSAFSIGPDGTILGTYDKVHLVPFGEYVPLQGVLFFVNRLARGTIAGFASGRRLDPLPSPGGRAATFICYEAIFPELVRRLARGDAAFLVNITNDAWFGRSAAASQHLAMAVVRAVENRRFLVRAANTGISAIVDPSGRIVARTGLFETAVLHGAVRARSGRTFYAAAGDAFAWGCVILSVFHVAALRAAFARQGP